MLKGQSKAPGVPLNAFKTVIVLLVLIVILVAMMNIKLPSCLGSGVGNIVSCLQQATDFLGAKRGII